MRRRELSIPYLLDLRLEMKFTNNDLINHAYVVKSPQKHKGQGLENFQGGEHMEIWGE